MKKTEELAKVMNPWLELFDQDLSNQELPLSQRPIRALTMLIGKEVITGKAKDGQIIDLFNFVDNAEATWFRVLFEAVNYWYVERFGEPAMIGTGGQPLIGAVMVRGVPFALNIPANRMEVTIEGEQVWMHFEEGLGEGEEAVDWIIDGPELAKLDSDAHAIVSEEATQTAEILRYVEFRRVTACSDGDEEVRNLVQSTLTYLRQAAKRMVPPQMAERGLAWFDLQMANEAALKAVIRLETGTQPHIHFLGKLLEQANVPSECFDPTRLASWPAFRDLSDWRYGQGTPLGVGELYSAYRTTLDLVKAAMKRVPPGMPAGFKLLIKYTPWSAKDATGVYRE